MTCTDGEVRDEVFGDDEVTTAVLPSLDTALYCQTPAPPGKHASILVSKVVCAAPPGHQTPGSPTAAKVDSELRGAAAAEGAGMANLDRTAGARRPSTGPCVYKKGGVCSLHGPGARRRWKPVRTREVGADGAVRMKTTRLYYYECDVGDKGVRRQNKLSFGSGNRTTRTPGQQTLENFTSTGGNTDGLGDDEQRAGII